MAEADGEAVALVVHDAARPLVPEEVIERVLTRARRGLGRGRAGRYRCRTRSSASTANGSSRHSRATSSRAVQTPQAFAADVLRAALEGDVAGASDCASLVEARGGRVAVVPGDRRLLKVTTPEDLALVESWLAGE